MSGTRVLLVDDEELFVTALAKRMAKRGLSVDTAPDGTTALEMVRERGFDAIVLDLAMPGMDGIETLEKMLQLNPDLQVILLTGHGSVQAGVEAMKHGAVDFLEKPADFQELLQKIEQAAAKKMLLVEKHAEDEVEDILRKKGW